jgi:hypothetical protein
MGELYVKRRVAEYGGVYFIDYVDIKEEMMNAYMKLHMEYVIDEFPPADSCYYKIRKHYIEHNGLELQKEISLVIGLDEYIQPSNNFKCHFPNFKG